MLDKEFEAKHNAKTQMNRLKVQGLQNHSIEEIKKKQNLRKELTLEIKKAKKEENKLAKQFVPENQS